MGFTNRVFSRNFYERKTAPKIKSLIEFQNSILEIVLLNFAADRNYFSVGNPTDRNYFSVGNPRVEQKEMVETTSQHNENYAL